MCNLHPARFFCKCVWEKRPSDSFQHIGYEGLWAFEETMCDTAKATTKTAGREIYCRPENCKQLPFTIVWKDMFCPSKTSSGTCRGHLQPDLNLDVIINLRYRYIGRGPLLFRHALGGMGYVAGAPTGQRPLPNMFNPLPNLSPLSLQPGTTKDPFGPMLDYDGMPLLTSPLPSMEAFANTRFSASPPQSRHLQNTGSQASSPANSSHSKGHKELINQTQQEEPKKAGDNKTMKRKQEQARQNELRKQKRAEETAAQSIARREQNLKVKKKWTEKQLANETPDQVIARKEKQKARASAAHKEKTKTETVEESIQRRNARNQRDRRRKEETRKKAHQNGSSTEKKPNSPGKKKPTLGQPLPRVGMRDEELGGASGTDWNFYSPGEQVRAEKRTAEWRKKKEAVK
ncbi:hypothetical protein CC80DRAFT_289024 [Byssothecium circinans]|uniref:Uncharacterized protein n=1 Tax=Byssothecium circinans TaxID=147558 RepID=A0A6A5U6D1_9PLEO|nr:hypothetical protein CC80DRAFT_289024 [Byssothecium circinans]